MSERRRLQARTALDEARRLVDSGDAHGALRPLERARADFYADRDLDALRDLRGVMERGYHAAEPEDEGSYEGLLYASAQNIRFLSRSRAVAQAVDWKDPHPELDQLGRPEIRVERAGTRSTRRWVVAVSIGAATLATGAVLSIVLTLDRGTLVNDTDSPVRYLACGDAISGWSTLLPGTGKRFTTWGICVDVQGRDLDCRLRIADGETVRVSQLRNGVSGCGDAGSGGAGSASASLRPARSRR